MAHPKLIALFKLTPHQTEDEHENEKDQADEANKHMISAPTMSQLHPRFGKDSPALRR